MPLRPGALAALTVSDFDAHLGTVTVRNDKATETRHVVLPPTTAAFFADQIGGRSGDAPLLARADGLAWTKDAWKKPLKQAVADAKLPAGTVAYALRHSVITDLIALHGLNTVAVARIAGTSLQIIEKNYGHLLMDRTRSALARLAL